MTENLLQFIWQFQYFNKQELVTEKNETLFILKPGVLNANQGPDFLEASVKIGIITLAGNIELHLRSSDWYRHNHTSDKNYSNIILHVVWENDVRVKDQHSFEIPTLVLQDRVAKVLLQRYELLMNNPCPLHCKNFLPGISYLSWTSWKERLAVERLSIKSQKVLNIYEECKHHWEETLWWIIASNFGMKVNSTLFENVARTISINILGKHKNQINQLEAILFGQANLLEGEFTDAYPKLLQREYKFLSKKYGLLKINNSPFFLRMRPANFPTIRMAQLAMLIHRSNHLFSSIIVKNDLKEIEALFDITCNDYWHYHFTFYDTTGYKPKHLGAQMVNNLLINAVIPVLFAYGIQMNDQSSKDKAVRWLSEIPPEANSITRIWKTQPIKNGNAMDSQALIHLTNNYCSQKLCLECAVGNKLLKATSEK